MTPLLIYFGILLAVFLMQRKMIYFPERYAWAEREELMVKLDLRPWPSASDMRGLMSGSPLAGAKGTVLVFHGNAGSALHRAYFIDALVRLDYRVIVAEYPGYGSRSGSPSESVLIEDGIAAAKMVVNEFPGPLFLCGESLGSGVVAGVVASQQVPVKGVLLITPFDTMARVAEHHYWFFLARWLLLDKYDNVTKLRDFAGPVAMVVAGRDEVVPNRRSLVLFGALQGIKRLWYFEQAGHNSLPLEAWQSWWSEAMEFLGRR